MLSEGSMKKILVSAAISLFGLALGIVCIEIGYRLLERSGGQAAWSDRPPFFFQHERSPTLQDYPIEPQKPENTFRIAVVGDSFTFAPYMQFTDAFPKKLEQMLNLNDVPLHAQVINYGVPGYSTNHEIEKVDEALAASSDLVILQVTLNDPELKGYRPTGIRDFNRFGPLKFSPTWEPLLRHWHSLRFALERLHNNKTQREYREYFLDLFENPRTRKPWEDATRTIAERCKQAGKPLVAVVFPLFGLPLDDKYPFHALHEQVKALMDSLNVPVLDLRELYRGIPLERLQVIPGGDRHPNEIAHRMAAERIYSWLVERSLIPESLRIKLRFRGRTQIVKETPFTE